MPKVSVLMITYNHEQFIEESLDSVLAQVTDFDFEIVIGEDCSTDRTREIVADYARRHPDVIRAKLNDVNIGSHSNFQESRERTRGEYVALLDGDDFWTSPDKLQLQKDYLDAHPDCSLVFHPADILRTDGRVRTWFPPGRKSTYDLQDLLKGNFIATGSAMCRDGRGVELPEWHDVSQRMPTDWILFSLLARRGFIGYIGQTMSVYRLHDAGVWAVAPTKERVRRLKMSMDICRRLNADFDHEYTPTVRYAIAVLWLKIGIQRTVPFLVDPLTSLRYRLSDVVARFRR